MYQGVHSLPSVRRALHSSLLFAISILFPFYAFGFSLDANVPIRHSTVVGITVSIRITANDYLKASYLHLRPRPFLMFLALFVLALVLFVILVSVKSGQVVMPIAAGCLLLFYALWLGVLLPTQARRVYGQSKLLQEPYEVLINEDGFETKSPYGGGKIPWNMFHKWKENRRMILVYQSELLFHMFPKRCFASESDFDKLREFLTKQLGPSRA
jgi:YcxB-like protein